MAILPTAGESPGRALVSTTEGIATPAPSKNNKDHK